MSIAAQKPKPKNNSKAHQQENGWKKLVYSCNEILS